MVIKYGGTSNDNQFWEIAFPMAAINPNSFSVTPLLVHDMNGNIAGHGTGWIYKIGQETFLITSWHVVSGRDFFSPNNVTHQLGLLPNRFEFFLPFFTQSSGEVISAGRKSIILTIERNGTTYFDEPPNIKGNPVDIAIFKIDISIVREGGGFPTNELDKIPFFLTDSRQCDVTSVCGDDVFVSGYPLSTFEGMMTPIWKRGSIASELGMDLNSKVCF